jgi:CheY-like chemotaxis protein
LGRTDFDIESLRGVNVLLVDDDRDSQEVFGAILRYYGALVTPSLTVRAALRKLQRVTPDVIVLDLILPDGNGLALAREIRALPSCARIPLIAVTGHSDVNSREAALGAGFDVYLTKPVEPAVLCRTIAHAIAGPRDSGANPGGG